MRDQYDLRGGRPNPYAGRISSAGRAELLRRFREAEHLVRLDDDVAAVFTTEESVNEALRLPSGARDHTEAGSGTCDQAGSGKAAGDLEVALEALMLELGSARRPRTCWPTTRMAGLRSASRLFPALTLTDFGQR